MFSHTNLCNQVSVLCMHLSYSSYLLTPGEGSVQLRVLQHVQTLIGHEHLEGVDSLLFGQRLHLLFDLKKKHVRRHIYTLHPVSSSLFLYTDTHTLTFDLFGYITVMPLHLVAPPRDGNMQ